MLYVNGQSYEWDEDKRALNLARHGIDFEAIEYFRWETAKVRPSDRGGETRYLALGFIGDRVHAVVYTLRHDRTRLISMRRANKTEVKEHEEYLRATDLPD